MNQKRLKMQIALSIVFIAILSFYAFKLFEAQGNYRAENELHEQLLAYRPMIEADLDTSDNPDQTRALNQSKPDNASLPDNTLVYNNEIAELRKLNSDAVGWIRLDDTAIDYPFAQGLDNDFYLRHDINQEYAYAGTVFVDYRCRADFMDYNTILYGHNMKNGSMFHDLVRFEDREFFDSHSSGVINLENKNLKIEIFAYLTLSPMDLNIFSREGSAREQLQGYLDYLRSHASQWRDECSISYDDKLVTLSTCSYDYNDARAVVVAKIYQ